MDFLQKIAERFLIITSNYEIIGVFVLILMLIFSKKHRTINMEWISKFVGFMVLVMFIKLAFLSLRGAGVQNIFGLNYSNFIFVGLEDAFFVVIPYYLTKLIKYKPVNFLIWTFFTVAFAIGHLYQGVFAVAITSLYPYFISRKYAEKTSFLNVMICHFIYDCFVLLTIKLHNIGVFI